MIETPEQQHERAMAHVGSILRACDESNAKRVSEGGECNHRYEWHPGTNVEMGMDSGYFCRRCGKERDA